MKAVLEKLQGLVNDKLDKLADKDEMSEKESELNDALEELQSAIDTVMDLLA